MLYITNDKRGTTSVFLMVILGAMISLTIAFAAVSMQMAGTSYANGVFYLAGRSVLAEFDTALKDRYGIFGFYGKPSQLRSKLYRYSYASFREKEHMRIDDINVDLKEHSLINADVFSGEITACAKADTASRLIPKEGDIPRPAVVTGVRELKNERIIKSLPSFGMDEGGLDTMALIRSLKGGPVTQLWEEGSERYFIDAYIFSHFKNGQNTQIEGNTFFVNECEYIIVGKNSDHANKNGVDIRITALRTGLNTAYIYSNPAKMRETLALAEIMTPGPEAVLTQALIIAAWALAEANNDIALLNAGHNVPIWKDESSWATDLDGAINKELAECIMTGNESGFCYEDYLKILMAVVPVSRKLTRSMDLIQINMQGTYWEDFYIKDYYVGFKFNATMNGRELSFEECY